MKTLWKLTAIGIALVLAGCASQKAADTEPPEPEVVVQEVAPVVEEPVVEQPVEAAPPEPGPLDAEGIAGFVTGDGAPVSHSASLSLFTGGSVSGRLLPTSSNPDVTLYLTRDGSVPSADSNWGGPVSPSAPRMITRQQEGSGVYKVVAELDGEYSDVVTVFVSWRHEESPVLAAPTFEVAGRAVSGEADIPVSDGTDMNGRLYISSDYAAATLYISRDGSDPSPEKFWKSQVADGTYLFSPEPTAAAYRVIAVWQNGRSPVATLDVNWVE